MPGFGGSNMGPLDWMSPLFHQEYSMRRSPIWSQWVRPTKAWIVATIRGLWSQAEVLVTSSNLLVETRPWFQAQTGMWQLDNLICDKFSVCDALLEDVVCSKQNRTKKKGHTWIWTKTLLLAIPVFKKIQGHTWIWTQVLSLTMITKPSHHHATRIYMNTSPLFNHSNCTLVHWT